MQQTNREAAIDCLLEICRDPEAKSSDRVAAAKLLLELDRPEEESSNTITVIMEGVAKEYCG